MNNIVARTALRYAAAAYAGLAVLLLGRREL